MKEFYRLKYRMSVESDTAEVMVYSEIASETWWGDETTTGDFDKAIKEARANGARKLNIRINSGGGEVYAAVAMRSMVINAGFESVRIMIEGLCASAATLFATIPGAHVVIAQGSEFMIHNPSTIVWGNAHEMQKEIDHLHSLEEQFHDMYARKTGESTEQIKAWMDETTWFKASEAVEHHFCDELLETAPAAACVTGKEMAMMKAMYARVPEDITIRETEDRAPGTVPMRGQSPHGGAEYILTPEERENNLKTLRDAAANYIYRAEDKGAEAPGTVPMRGQSPLREAEAPEPNTAGQNGRTENPVAGFSSVIDSQKEEETETMEIKDITRDQLLSENPALAEEIAENAIRAERERIAEIDDLTAPGYEAMAEEAKRSGQSAMDFQKAVVKAMREKGSTFMAQRQQETAPAAQITGGAASDTTRNEDEEIRAFAKEMAGYVTGDRNEGMF